MFSLVYRVQRYCKPSEMPNYLAFLFLNQSTRRESLLSRVRVLILKKE